jgi:predicted regulator of Ras-like GTPase activity (Roadblock/LC7/MglB family)
VAVEEVRGILNSLLSVREVKVAVVVGEDGLVLDSVGAKDADVEEIGAICSNGYLTLKRTGEELGYGHVVQSITRYQSGVIVLSRLPNQLTMAVVATNKANLAEVWNATGNILTEVAKLLR